MPFSITEEFQDENNSIADDVQQKVIKGTTCNNICP